VVFIIITYFYHKILKLKRPSRLIRRLSTERILFCCSCVCLHIVNGGCSESVVIIVDRTAFALFKRGIVPVPFSVLRGGIGAARTLLPFALRHVGDQRLVSPHAHTTHHQTAPPANKTTFYQQSLKIKLLYNTYHSHFITERVSMSKNIRSISGIRDNGKHIAVWSQPVSSVCLVIL
jgi:hypothetical protein